MLGPVVGLYRGATRILKCALGHNAGETPAPDPCVCVCAFLRARLQAGWPVGVLLDRYGWGAVPLAAQAAAALILAARAVANPRLTL